MRAWLVRSLVLLFGAAACNSTDQGTIQLETGEETDVFTQAPAPTTLVVYAVGASDADGGVTELASGPVSSTSIDLGNQDENGTAALQVFGETDAGAVVVFGESLSLEYGAIAGGTLPLFVQRTNELARMPSPPVDSRSWPMLAIITDEFLFIGGGASAASSTDGGTQAGGSEVDASAAETTQLYDFAGYAPLSSPPTLSYVPSSMPIVGTYALLISSGSDSAYYYDFSQDAYYTPGATLPNNGMNKTFQDIAGGQTMYDVAPTNGNLNGVYVAGATRLQGAATEAVLYVDPNDTSDSSEPLGKMYAYLLETARLGAAAVAIDGRGLVVFGGSASGSGVEVVGPSAVQPNAGVFPSDATTGVGAAALPGDNGAAPTKVILAGGLTPQGNDAGVRVVDLSCSMSCTPAPWGSTSPVHLPTPLANAYTFVNNAGSLAYVVGNEPGTGKTDSYLVSSTGTVTPVPMKEPHVGAAAIESPVGSVLVFGGPSEDLESFTFPPALP